MDREDNPILGWRAIRFCLANPALFKTQLRAMLRASVHGHLKIMFPMISGLEELEQSLEMLKQARAELESEGVPVAEEVPVGVMIEIPSAALISDVLAGRVDFFSIGTNDLIQYTMAVDRGNERIAYLYQPFHMGVLKLIRLVVENAHQAGIPVGMCGELAGDPAATMVLLGLGLDELSMSPFSIPEIKKIVRSVSLAEAKDALERVLSMTNARKAGEYMNSLVAERFGIAVGEG